MSTESQAVLSDWQWLYMYSTTILCAEALARRTSFPAEFVASHCDSEEELEKLPHVNFSFALKFVL